MKVVIDATGVSGVVVDGVTWAPVSGAPPGPTGPTGPTGTPPPPSGNPGAILPPLPWPAGSPQSNMQHLFYPSGQIVCYEVPALYQGAAAVVFTFGADANTGPGSLEFSVGQSPGIIDPNGAAGGYYFRSNNLAYNSMQLFRNPGDPRMPMVPSGQVWYFNILVKSSNGLPSIGGSAQWVSGG